MNLEITYRYEDAYNHWLSYLLKHKNNIELCNTSEGGTNVFKLKYFN